MTNDRIPSLVVNRTVCCVDMPFFGTVSIKPILQPPFLSFLSPLYPILSLLHPTLSSSDLKTTSKSDYLPCGHVEDPSTMTKMETRSKVIPKWMKTMLTLISTSLRRVSPLCFSFPADELLITSRMLKSNTGASLIVWMVGVIARLIAKPEAMYITIRIILESLLNAFLYAYVFDILYQITSVEEDTINKPHRPIPSGLLSMHGAKIRMALSWVLSYPIIYTVTGRNAARLLFYWEVWSLFCYVWPSINHWFCRNAFAGLGVFIMYRWINVIVGNHVPGANIRPVFDVIFALWVTCTCHLQEFHDVDGDCRAGRRTIAVILQPSASLLLRRCTAIFMLLWAWFCFRCLQHYHFSQDTYVKLLVASCLYLWVCLVVAVRTWSPRKKDYDERTYKVYYIMASCLFSLYLRILGSVLVPM